MIIM
jgi:hypothetical protein